MSGEKYVPIDVKYVPGPKYSATVKQLIEALQQFPPDAMVYTEGCDCTGSVSGVRLHSDGSVMVER